MKYLQKEYIHEGHPYPDATLVITRLVGTVETEEELESADNYVRLSYKRNMKHVAQVFVYSDLESYNRNVLPLHHFGIEFEYDLEDEVNIYTKAYMALENIKQFKDQ